MGFIFTIHFSLLIAFLLVSRAGAIDNATARQRPTLPEQVSALKYERYEHTTTLLADGRVVVSGGCEQDKTTATNIEIWNPLTNTWVLGPAMKIPRCRHGAVLLNDGRILIAGGTDNSRWYNGQWPGPTMTEIYDPKTNSISPGPEMKNAHLDPTIFALNDGLHVLLIENKSRAWSELLDLRTMTWSEVQSIPIGYWGIKSILLPSGKILLAGGTDADHGKDASPNSFIYDPVKTLWKAISPLGRSREAFSMMLLSDGHVLAGPGPNYGNLMSDTCRAYEDSFENFDPDTMRWNMSHAVFVFPRHAYRLLRLSNGLLGVAGGFQNSESCDSPEDRSWISTVEIYSSESDRWSDSHYHLHPMLSFKEFDTATWTPLPHDRVLLIYGRVARKIDFSALLLDSPTAPMPAKSASFDCTQAKPGSEQTICGNDSLALADKEMAILYHSLLGHIPLEQKNGLRQTQRDWLKQRDTECASDLPRCKAFYEKRIAELRKGK